MFFCCRSQYESNRYLFCSKVYLRNKKIVTHLKKKTIKVLVYFSVELSFGVKTDGSINLFVHCSISDRQKLNGSNDNFGTLFYEVISCPFNLWKFFLDILARIVFNDCGKYIVPALLPGIETEECRNFTVCSPMYCFGLKKDKTIETAFYFWCLFFSKTS